MKEQMALVLVEPGFRQAHWWQVYEEGLNEALSRRSLTCSYVFADAIPDNQLPASRLAILFGSSAAWLQTVLLDCRRLHLRPVLVSPEPKQQLEGVSLVSPDRMVSTRRLVAYLVYHGKKHLAMFSPRPESVNGRRREEAFLSACGDEGVASWIVHDPKARVCLERLLERIDRIDAVICVDDLTGVYCLSGLADAGIRVPEQLYVAGFGDSVLSRYARPPLTTVTLDLRELARQAVSCVLYLHRNPEAVSLHCLVANRLIVRASTDHCPDAGTQQNKRPENSEAVVIPDKAVSDPDLQRINDLEACLSHADPMDLTIMETLLCGSSCRQIARRLYVSESTVYYRIERLCQRSGMPDRDAFLALLQQYTSCFLKTDNQGMS